MAFVVSSVTFVYASVFATSKKGSPIRAAFPVFEVLKSYRGFVDASPFAFGLFALGFCELFSLGVVLWLGLEFPAGLLPIDPDEAAAPFPATVTRSLTRRLPANELAIRRAVCFSFPFCTFPLSSMVLSVTLTFTLSFFSVGSFCRAF